MVTPIMLAREVLCLLPSDGATECEEMLDGSLQLRFTTAGGEGWLRVSKADRLRSLVMVADFLRPELNEQLFAIWART